MKERCLKVPESSEELMEMVEYTAMATLQGMCKLIKKIEVRLCIQF